MMAGERDRDRGPRGDTSAPTSLWIDYLLLPEKLEEHLAALAAGNVFSPSPGELITVFLEQALLSQKASLGYSLPGIAKDVPDAWTTVTKTAALLSERAARVAVSANLSLEEIEACINSAQHQFMLLKALVKHDKPRLLIHECDLNRWMLRNALQSHPLGSAAPNASLSAGPQAVVWTLGEDVPVEAPDNGCLSVSVSRNGAVRGPIEEEKLAIEFLENVLLHRDGVCPRGTSSECKLATIVSQDRSGGDISEGAFLSQGYWCQIMLDVAEVHFMRGRIHVAHELFTKCAELNQRISETDKADGQLKRLDNGGLASSVPMQRLSGFIVACRMLLGLHPRSNVSDGRQRDLNEIELKSSSLLSLGELSVTQKTVIACERSRYNLKQTSEAAQRTPEDSDFTVSPPYKKLKSFHDSEYEKATKTEVVAGVDVSLDPIASFKEKFLESMGMNESADEVPNAESERECARLIRNVVGDTLEGHLKKGYRLSLARDSGIPVSINCKLVACNVVRDIVERAPMQSFLQSSNVFRDSVKGVHFLMSLMAAVQKSLNESAVANGSVPKPQLTERTYDRQGSERTSTRSIGDKMSLSTYISEFAMYVCSILDAVWCWEAALANNLINPVAIPKLFFSEPGVVGSGKSAQELLAGAIPAAQSLKNEFELEVMMCALLTTEDVWEIDRLVSKVDRVNEVLRGNEGLDSVGAHSEVKTGNNGTGVRFQLALDIAAILRRRAFNALDTTNQFSVARKLYELAKTVHSGDHDSVMMLWLLDKVSLKEGASASLAGVGDFEGEISIDLGALEYVLLSLIEKERWNDLSELCEWGLSLLKKEKSSGGDEGQGTGKHIWCRRCARILKVATALAELMQLCSALLQATSQNHYTEDVARMSSKASQLFEEFLSFLAGGDIEGSSSMSEDGSQSWSAAQQNRKPLLNPSVRTVPLISQLTNSRVLINLASLTAGWLHRCNIAGLLPWPLSMERYGTLATVTSGASLPPLGTGGFSPFPLRVVPEFGRNLFGVLLERIVELPGVVERDKEKGHRWLQGLADLAFEDEAYVKALQLYLQAGGIKSAFYCDRSSAMPEEVFTQWVLRRMVQACRLIGATVQAALLCQKLPGPDHELAFRILQENSLIVVRDAVAYFDCVWEVPLLELLVHMHAKGGDHERHSALISLLQQPALNAHNPQSVRVAHVASLEQRFLQRLCGELL